MPVLSEHPWEGNIHSLGGLAKNPRSAVRAETRSVQMTGSSADSVGPEVPVQVCKGEGCRL